MDGVIQEYVSCSTNNCDPTRFQSLFKIGNHQQFTSISCYNALAEDKQSFMDLKNCSLGFTDQLRNKIETIPLNYEFGKKNKLPVIKKVDNDTKNQYTSSSTMSSDTKEEVIPLPLYSCSVHLEGFILQRVDKESFQEVSRKVFKRVFLILHGTIIKEFESPPTSMDIQPTRITSTQFAKVLAPSSRENKKKLQLCLITPSSTFVWIFDTFDSMKLWHENIDMSIGIATSLEARELSGRSGRPARRRT
ncbi:hypothetical protein ROZALSC1DRAFT_30416 [Rozella allomycis CSF55]|uniref:PH domain-containing protein n=1 Tax=Rozella allomycis (strain CSF55) TaxID=988480 RepID=A0A075B3H7_ROZAC|nr:hypothetical protein O9G_003047 [Rozella allomycis CSF55]RKP17822.1 hypothetical protein ROZALSC1DRAFT_30416 [Rozella allomycis CSF55]|eukprot:EPZ35393.1 hypothetical protein O9G_003047 [Rozella allomycis CSF55]